MSVSRMPGSKSRAEQGGALIEFLFVALFLIFPLLLGTFVFGMSLLRANQVSEICRDAGHMFAYGVDFSQPNSKAMLVKLAEGLNMTATAGNGVIILSTVTYVADSDCIAAGYPSGSCSNSGQTVFVRRIVIGNAILHNSSFGTPSSGIIDNTGSISNTNYLRNSSAQAVNFANLIPLSSGQYAYMAEAFVVSPDFNLWSSNSTWNWINSGGISARSVF